MRSQIEVTLEPLIGGRADLQGPPLRVIMRRIVAPRLGHLVHVYEVDDLDYLTARAKRAYQACGALGRSNEDSVLDEYVHRLSPPRRFGQSDNQSRPAELVDVEQGSVVGVAERARSSKDE